MSETADKMPSPGLLAQASSHYVTLSYYIIRHLACQLFFPVIFNKIPDISGSLFSEPQISSLLIYQPSH